MLRIVAIIINTKFDPFVQFLKGFYNYFYEIILSYLLFKFRKILLDHVNGALAVLLMRYRFILYRLVRSHLMLVGLLKMNIIEHLLMKRDLKQNFAWDIL
jgi:hypothetical protein